MTDTQTNALTREEMDAVPVGYRIQDRDGDLLTRREGGYSFTKTLDTMGDKALLMRTGVLVRMFFAPFTMAPLTTEELEALPVGSVIADRDGEHVVQVSAGRWGYVHMQGDVDFWGPKTGPTSGLTFGPYTLVSEGPTNA